MKKKLLLLTALFVLTLSKAQQKDRKNYITSNINFTFALNENYRLFNSEDGENMLKFSAVLLRAGFGRRLNRLWSVGVNLGYDYHPKFEIQAIPTYGTVRYNISEDGSDAFYIEGGYGVLWRFNENFNNGNYYKVGLGVDLGSSGRFSTAIKLDFHRKGIQGFKNDYLDSVSLGIGFSFL